MKRRIEALVAMYPSSRTRTVSKSPSLSFNPPLSLELQMTRSLPKIKTILKIQITATTEYRGYLMPFLCPLTTPTQGPYEGRCLHNSLLDESRNAFTYHGSVFKAIAAY